MPDESLQRNWPDSGGHFSTLGGRFVPEIAMTPLLDLEKAWQQLRVSSTYWEELLGLLSSFAGRPTPLYEATRLESRSRIVLKREGGGTALTTCLGQALVARDMKKQRVLCECGSGLHGIAAATACARLDLPCVVYMGADDMERQRHSVGVIEGLGARVVRVGSGSRTLRDAVGAAMRDWMFHTSDTFYMARGPYGPHPYPLMLRDLGSLVGAEARRQVEALGRPSAVISAVGDALAMFYAFVPQEDVRLIAVESEGAAAVSRGSHGVLHGTLTQVLQNDDGQLLPSRSVAAGLDYPAAPPELSHLVSSGRVECVAVSDADAVDAFRRLSAMEGIVGSIESAHALACALRLDVGDGVVLVHLDGSGDKDLAYVRECEAVVETGEMPAITVEMEAPAS